MSSCETHVKLVILCGRCVGLLGIGIGRILVGIIIVELEVEVKLLLILLLLLHASKEVCRVLLLCRCCCRGGVLDSVDVRHDSVVSGGGLMGCFAIRRKEVRFTQL